MVKETQLYDALGVKPDADEKAITRAFRKLALKHHPDRPGGDAEKFQEMSNAHDVLSDEKKRALYDEHGEEGLKEGGPPPDDQGMSLSDILSGRRPGQNREPKPKDIVHEMGIRLEEFYCGATKKIAVWRKRLCAECDASGVRKECGKARDDFRCFSCEGAGYRVQVRNMGFFAQQVKEACAACDGEGCKIPEEERCGGCGGSRVVTDKKIFSVDIDKGMKRGDIVSISGEGDQIPGVKLSGDIVILLAQKPHAFFQRRGRHLFFQHSVTLAQALCGWELPVEHLDGRRIVLRTRPGQVFDPQKIWVVDREGMPVKGTGGTEKGMLIVTLDVAFPDQITTAEAGKLLEGLGEPDPVSLPGAGDDGEPGYVRCEMAEVEEKAPPGTEWGCVGVYVVAVPEGVAVTENVEPKREEVVCELPFQHPVQVIEVVRYEEGRRLRGQIAEPPGWVSLEDLDDGSRWFHGPVSMDDDDDGGEEGMGGQQVQCQHQ